MDRLKKNMVLISLALYLLPTIILAWLWQHQSFKQTGWTLFSYGLFISFIGSAIQFLILRNEQQRDPKVVEQKPEWDNSKLNEEIETYKQEIRRMESEKTNNEQQIHILNLNIEDQKREIEDLIVEKERVLASAQETIAQQEARLVDQQRMIEDLEIREKDLKYEVKALLQLTTLKDEEDAKLPETSLSLKETESSYTYEIESAPSASYRATIASIKTPEAAMVQLKRCIDIATKMAGSHHLDGMAKYNDTLPDSQALDLRRLCDSLRAENGLILVYSKKDNKLLFANNSVKNALGWSPEKFIQNFPEIAHEGADEWKKGINQAAAQGSVSFRMPFKHKAGNPIPLQCHLGIVNSGLFRNHILGVLYQVEN